MDSKIIEKKNSDEFNNSGIESLPLKVGFFNRLLRDFDTIYSYFIAMIPSLGTLNGNTISEYTSGSGVTIDSFLIKDGKAGATNSVTANTAGIGTGLISALEQTVVITSSGATKVITLPLLSTMATGGQISGTLLNTGCYLKPNASDQIVSKYINGATGGNFLTLNSATAAYFEAVKLNINKWIVKTYSSLGAPTTSTAHK
jgi:hypothetical protein